MVQRAEHTSEERQQVEFLCYSNVACVQFVARPAIPRSAASHNFSQLLNNLQQLCFQGP
jgi:hypothetical protein